jgi:O-antigen/teichoic acid export membrane protein
MHFHLPRRIILQNIAYLFSGTAITQGITAVTTLIIARQLGPDSYGQYAASLVLVSFTSIIFSLGLNTWFLHEASRNPEEHNHLLGSTLAIKLLIGIPWLIVTYILAGFLDSNTFPQDIVILSALVVFFDNIFSTLLTSFKVLFKNQLTFILMLGSDLLWMIGTIVLIYLDYESILIYIFFRAIILFVSLLAAGWLASSFLHPTWNIETMKRAWKVSFPYATSEFLVLSSLRIDVLIVAFLSGKQAAGLYSPAVGIVNALFLPLGSISGVILPILSNQFAHNTKLAWETAKRAIWLFVIIGAGIAAALGFLARFTTIILGSGYGSSQDIVQILSIILLIHAIILAMTNILIATDQQGKRAIIQTAAVGLNIVLDLIVVPIAGIRGAAWVYVITEVFMLFGLTRLVIIYKTRSKEVVTHPLIRS